MKLFLEFKFAFEKFLTVERLCQLYNLSIHQNRVTAFLITTGNDQMPNISADEESSDFTQRRFSRFLPKSLKKVVSEKVKIFQILSDVERSLTFNDDYLTYRTGYIFLVDNIY